MYTMNKLPDSPKGKQTIPETTELLSSRPKGEEWTFEDVVDFYWKLSKSTYVDKGGLACKIQYFGPEDIHLVEQIEKILNPNGLKTKYSSVFQTIKFAKEHRQRNYVSDAIAERLLNMHALYVAAGQKYSMEHVNRKLAVTVIIYIGHINSLLKHGHLFDYRYFDDSGKEIAKLLGLKTPTQFSAYMRKEKTYLMKALLRYTLFPAAFSATSVFLENHNALIAEKPRFLPPDFSDAEIWIAVIIGRHGSIIAEELNICIVSAASTFIQDSKTRGYRLVDAHTINEETPLWLRASVLSDILDLDMGVPKCMAAEIEASKEVYEKLHKKSAPLVLPEPIFAPTRTNPQDAIANKSSSRLDPKLIDELVMVVTDYPVSEEKNMYIQNFLDSYFAEIPKGNDSDQSAL